MEENKNKVSKLYFMASFLIVFIFSFFIFFVFEVKVGNIKLEELKENEEELVAFQNQLLGEKFRTILGDVHYLHHIHGKDLYSNENINHISENWIEFSNQRLVYDQIRYIDKFGDEKTRINYNDDKASLVEESQLQNKKDRYYFYETKKLENETIFVSPLDLNIEGNIIEKPFKPMIRFSTPLYDDNNDFQGIIILNYLANTVLEDFKKLAKNSEGSFALLNSDGYWLSCEDENNEWNFMFDDKKDITFSNDYPKEWEKISQGKGQFISDNGLFTFAPVHLNHNYSRGDNYKTDEYIELSDSNWQIVSLVGWEHELAAYFSDNFFLTIRNVLRKNTYQLSLIAVFSILIGFLVYLNRKKYYKIKFFSEYDPLTKTLNRRAGYSQIKNLIYKNEKRTALFSLCFIDINGLKQVNDNLGHECGDDLLISVCNTIKSNIRELDFLIRQGGDEFIIIFNGINKKDAEKIWNRIISKFQEINKNTNKPYIISVSHGIVEYASAQKINIDDLIQLADDKMYQEKEIMKKNLNVLK